LRIKYELDTDLIKRVELVRAGGNTPLGLKKDADLIGWAESVVSAYNIESFGEI
jgi:hypothetical protein